MCHCIKLIHFEHVSYKVVWGLGESQALSPVARVERAGAVRADSASQSHAVRDASVLLQQPHVRVDQAASLGLRRGVTLGEVPYSA